MYANNLFSKRRQDGWAERQRYFRRLTEAIRSSLAPSKPAPAGQNDKPKA